MTLKELRLVMFLFFILIPLSSHAVPSQYKQWVIGANKAGYIYPKKHGNRSSARNYNIKGTVLRKFLQYEKQGKWQGINIGWTDNASANTAIKRAKWYFSRRSNSTQAIRYGEPIAIAWNRGKKTYIKYGHRKVGINLHWSKAPIYEWVFLGGKHGQPVRRGTDRVMIYNIKHKYPLIMFNRAIGGDIGWPDSSRWGRHIKAAKGGIKRVGGGFKWVYNEGKKELNRSLFVCKGDPVCISKIKLYQTYMAQLRSRTKMYRLPPKYLRYASLYPQLGNLKGYRFGYSNHQPKQNATTDCNKTYYNDKKYVNQLKQGRVHSTRLYWLLHELQHYNQCKRVGGRDNYALMWFRDLDISIIRKRNLKNIHDRMPMEKEATNVAISLCKRIKECIVPSKYK